MVEKAITACLQRTAGQAVSAQQLAGAEAQPVRDAQGPARNLTGETPRMGSGEKEDVEPAQHRTTGHGGPTVDEDATQRIVQPGREGFASLFLEREIRHYQSTPALPPE